MKLFNAGIRPAAVVAFVLTAVNAVATDEVPTFGEYKAKGFLTDYANIKPVGEDSDAYRYRAPDLDLSKYDKLLVDRIKIWFKDDADYQGIDADELKQLTDYFYEQLEKKVGDKYPMVAEAGADVLRLRIAVTDLVPNKPAASVTSLVVPFLWVGEATAGAATRKAGTTPFTGEATIEAEALDSVTSKQLAAYIETRMGKKYAWSEGVSKGISSYMKAYSTWEYTQQAIDYWVELLRKRLDEAHAAK